MKRIYIQKVIASLETFTAVMFQVEVFWVVEPCSDVVGYHPFEGHPED